MMINKEEYTFIRSFFHKGKLFWHVISNINVDVTYCIDCSDGEILFSVDCSDYCLRDKNNKIIGMFDTKETPNEPVISWVFVDNNGEVTYNNQTEKQFLSKFEVDIFMKFI